MIFKNFGKGAAWVLKVENNIVGGGAIETHIGVPVCVGPGSTGRVTIFFEGKIEYHIESILYLAIA